MTRTSFISRDESGLTLIEIMVAIFLVAVFMAVAVPAFKAATDADLRRTAMRISGASRAAYGEAAVKNVTLRLAYDLDAGAYWIEAYPGTFQISARERDLDDVRDEEKRRAEDEERERELAERYGKGGEESTMAPTQKFVPVQFGFVEPERLPEGLRITGVRTPQFKQVVRDGKAYTHFFPNGWAERTLVYLEDDGGSKMTLETEPLSGRVIVHDGELDYREADEARDRQERG